MPACRTDLAPLAGPRGVTGLSGTTMSMARPSSRSSAGARYPWLRHSCIEAKGALAMREEREETPQRSPKTDTNRTVEGLPVRFWAYDRRSSGGPIAQCNSAMCSPSETTALRGS
ncbi:MAG: hypothetical protein QOI89_3692 [Solirubrobacteraceae bacterium]|nr:hypothetical protein [Solirubrobacteraceae bacterium]